jgi:DKNYY family
MVVGAGYKLHVLYRQRSYAFAAIHIVCIFIKRQRFFSQTVVGCHIMKILPAIIIIIFCVTIYSCTNPGETDTVEKVYAKEPADSANYKYVKYDFYLSKSGQLSERKRVMVRPKGSACHCDFVVYYDSTVSIYNGDTMIEKPLNEIVDINSFTWIDSTDYSKDKNKVFYFHGNSDGGNRVIVDKADPATFKRLCEYRWGIDKNHVFYKTNILEGLDLKSIQILYPPDPSDNFIQYVKDEKNVFFESEIIQDADANTFKVVSGQKWDAEDKNYKYEAGRRKYNEQTAAGLEQK